MGNSKGMPPASRMPSLTRAASVEVDAIAGRQVAAGLRDADDGPARLQLFAGDAVVGVALDVDGGFTGLGHVVEPDFAAEPLAALSLISYHCSSKQRGLRGKRLARRRRDWRGVGSGGALRGRRTIGRRRAGTALTAESPGTTFWRQFRSGGNSGFVCGDGTQDCGAFDHRGTQHHARRVNDHGHHQPSHGVEGQRFHYEGCQQYSPGMPPSLSNRGRLSGCSVRCERRARCPRTSGRRTSPS